VSTPSSDFAALSAPAGDEPITVARNVTTRYLAIAVEMVVGLGVLPFNIAHLGKAAYGLWMLTASVTAYFSVLDLGYSGALVKFVAQYRAKRNARALNEILSTMFFLFVGFGVAIYVTAILLSLSMGRLFHLTPEQAQVGRIVLLVISVNVAVGIAFSVFGGVINGFQRYDLNNVVGAATSIVAAAVNVVVLLLGYGLVELVIATTTVRLLAYGIYRANAYRVFPGLQLRLSLFSRARLREVTTFSVYMALIDWAFKLNYSVDALVIGACLNTSAVAVWSIAQRIAETTQRLTNQLNEVLFPAIVDNDTTHRADRLQQIFLVGTRLSTATAIPVGGALMLLARPLIHAWVGPGFEESILILRLLAFTVIVRVSNATAGTLLRGAGAHRLVAFVNIATSIVNLTLSVALVFRLGLAGVALGTLIPVCLSAMLILFPAGCRRVGLSVGSAFARALWPALWPAAVMWAFVASTLPFVAESLVTVGIELVAAAGVYWLTFFFFGVSALERRFYFGKLSELIARRRVAVRAVSEGA
jgi:O-antigen/teichoic acid export membrane protein